MKTKTATLHPLAFAAALSLCALVPMKAHADAAGETVTAMTHADLASKAANLDGVHMHLHHALNCLVGSAGAGYDAKQMNPCANAGNGAIPDTADAAKKAALQEAAKSASDGITETDLGKAQADATAASSKLMAVK